MEQLPGELVLQIGITCVNELSLLSTKYYDLFNNTQNQKYMISNILSTHCYEGADKIKYAQIPWFIKYKIITRLLQVETSLNWLKIILMKMPPIRLNRLLNQTITASRFKNKVLCINFIKTKLPIYNNFTLRQLDELWNGLTLDIKPDWLDLSIWYMTQYIRQDQILTKFNEKSQYYNSRKKRLIKQLIELYSSSDLCKFCINRSLLLFTTMPHKPRELPKLHDVRLFLKYSEILSTFS